MAYFRCIIILFSRIIISFIIITINTAISSADTIDNFGTTLTSTVCPGTTPIKDSSRFYQTSGHKVTNLPKNYPWMFPGIYVVYAFCVVFLIITLVTYTCCLEQHNNSNYVKYYVAMLLLSILLNVIQEVFPIPGVFYHTLFYLLKLFILFVTQGWQVVMGIDVYLYVRFITTYNKFKNNFAKRNACYHLGCWGCSAILTMIVYLFQTDLEKNCLNSMFTSIFFPTNGFIIIIINGTLLYFTVRDYSAIVDERFRDEKWKQLEKKIMLRKKLFLISFILWFSDTLYWIKCNNFLWESDLNITSNIDFLKQSKIVQGFVTSFIFVCSAGIFRKNWRS